MFKTKSVVVATTMLLIAVASNGMAQTTADPHHPNQDPVGAASTIDQQAPGMMNMMDMMRMMSMMHGSGGGQMGMPGAGMAMGMGGLCMTGMAMNNRVEGRIAFLRAELKISDTQTELWNTFADALRDDAKQMKDNAGSAMMGAGAMGMIDQLAAREKALGVCLETVKSQRAALAPLYEALSEEQRKTAEELLGSHFRMMGGGMMGQGMMGGGMMGGGMMGQGMMGQGMMQDDAMPEPQ